MSKLGAKRPSPALVISMIALFVALGGSAYAAKKIGTKEIKANAITTGKIKKNAVTTAKIKANAVTGVKINEGTLGPVPSATNATTAETAKNFSRYFTSGLKKASIGQTVNLLSVGPFSFVGKCTDSGGNSVAKTYLTTSQPGSSMYSEYADSYSLGNFNPGIEAEVGYALEGTEPLSGFYGSYYTVVTAQSADGTTLIEGQANAAINMFGSPCAFQVHVLNNS